MGLQDFIEFDQKSKILFCKGNWDLENISNLQKILRKQPLKIEKEISIDGKNITKLDSGGAWILINEVMNLNKKGVIVNFVNFSKQHQKLLSLTKDKNKSRNDIPKSDELDWIQKLGKYSIFQVHELYDFINFLGEVFFDSLHVLRNSKLWHWNTFTSIINKAGAQALPIIALLAFTIGVVISYQMGNQLRKYGADVFIVELLGLSVLREFGPLLTAILVGGRTGSAFTAQLGIMKINQEIDALITMGIPPTELLIIPRLASLFIVVPLLTMWADLFGIIGGMLMAQYMLDITWYDFLLRFQQEIPLRSLIIGLAKAPIFALIIASTGCFEGIKVHGSAESVGTRTTRSVVLSIFFIILFDGIVSVLLSKYKL